MKKKEKKVKEKKIKKDKKISEKKMQMISTTISFVLMCVIIGFLFVPLFKGLKFGLDLQGGFEVLYRVDSIDGSKMTGEKMTATYKTLQKRIDSLGVNEPEIILEGKNNIRVKLAGITNQAEAREQLSTVATLSFRDVEDNLLMNSDVLKAGGAKIGQDSSGNPAVSLQVADKDKFYSVTNKVKDMEKNYIVIWLDFEEGKDSFAAESNLCGTNASNCLSAATVSQAFASDVIIQGNFTEDEVSNLVDLINSGSLPSKLTEISSKTVGASFGEGTLSKTFMAGLIGICLISLLLIFVYHFSGFISTVSIIFYTFLVFLVFWLVGGVLTLPGIAALVLGIGMAVDANVITYSRIQDELRQGKSLPFAFKTGSRTSLRTILDSNLTTLLVAIIMFVFGESSVKGFATVLIITIAVTMVTMVALTRLILSRFIKSGYFDDKTNLFINIKDKDKIDVTKENKEDIKKPFAKVNFFKHVKAFVITSVVIIALGLAVAGFKGLNLGIDYQAGSDISVETKEKLNKKDIQADMKNFDVSLRDIEVSGKNVNIRVKDVLKKKQIAEISKYFEDKYKASVEIGVVSNVVKKELTKNAIFSILISMIGIILYISIRFKFSYAISSVVALFHDVFMMIAVFAICRFEVSVMFIAAVLAIIGYSINDTIVCFDRIRENIDNYLKKNKKLSKEELKNQANKSIQDTFMRTIYTSITTLLPVIALIVLGSREILNFNIAMLIGLIAGTYSSIFIATTLFLKLESKSLGKEKKKKRVYREVEERKIKGINC
ncbi:MAG: protein translocase subunit SecD [Bacilli bacterium]|nr:protein translocase subunit SecD [Bacilli bacterium]